MNKFISHDGSELKDARIAKALRQAADDYENGEIAEVKDLLIEIVTAISRWEDVQDARGI